MAAASGEQWLEASSSHFTVITNSSEKDARHLVDQFERMRWTFQKLFPKMNVDPDEPIIILAAKNGKSFEALLPADRLGKGQMQLSGLFLRGMDKNYVLLRLDANQEHPYATIYHEYTHVQFRKFESWMPLWLNEGIAEFYENTVIHDKNVEVGQTSVNDILFLRENRLIPLTTLFQVDYKSPYYHEENKGNIFYAESWALTHFLINTDYENKTQKVTDYVRAINQGKDSISAAQEAFGDLNALQKQLEFYIRAGNYKEFMMNSAVAPIDESYYKIRQLSQNEADAYRAEFLAQEGRLVDAKAILDAILKTDQQNPIALEARGTIALRENDFTLALQLYEQAFQLGYQVQGFLERYASLILSQGMDDEKRAKAESVLRKLVQLYPKNPIPYDQLAGILRFESKHRDEARKLELQAIENDPSTLRYRLNLEGLLLTMEKFDDARAVLLEAKKKFSVANDQRQIDEHLGQIDSFIASTTQVHMNQVNEDSGGVTVVTGDVSAANAPKHPAGSATGPKHIIEGVVHGVVCNYPSQMDLTLVTPKKTFKLYSMNYFKIEFSTLNFSASDKFDPCKMDGLHAKITYADNPADTAVDGEAQSILLKK
jgi:Flp pilus assembly protein TadD